MGKSTISMAIFNSYAKLPEGIYRIISRELHEVDLQGQYWVQSTRTFLLLRHKPFL